MFIKIDTRHTMTIVVNTKYPALFLVVVLLQNISFGVNDVSCVIELIRV